MSAVRKTNVINEGESAEYLIFIKEGELNVNMNKSVLEINQYITKLGGIIPEDELEDIKARYNSDVIFRKFVEKKRPFIIAILQSKDIIGLDEYVFKQKFAFNVECKSNIVEYWKINKNVYFIYYNYYFSCLIHLNY